MNRLDTLFKNKSSEILSVFFTAGYPELNDTATIIETLDKSGADLIEVGMPFSDPVADGPVIQISNQKSLENGMSIATLFDQLKDIRQKSQIPLILMGYLNPALQYGIENFCAKCKEIGIDGLILPDMTPEVYQREYQGIFDKYGIYSIFLISPQSSDERIRFIDSLTKGFIYMVSSSSTTGAKSSIAQSQEAYFERVRQLNLKNPRMIGFGISNNETFKKACQYAHGTIIGSAFVKCLAQEGKLVDKIPIFIKDIRG